MAGCGLEVAGEPRNLSADATAADFGAALSEVFADDRVHSIVVIYTPPVQSNGAEVAQVLAAAAAGSKKPVVSTFLASRSVPAELRVPDADGGAARGSIPSFLNPQYAVGALAKATQYGEWRRRSDSRIPELPEVDTAGARTTSRSSCSGTRVVPTWRTPTGSGCSASTGSRCCRRSRC
jgi:acyl-CoA synthetase (NDP forming)